MSGVRGPLSVVKNRTLNSEFIFPHRVSPNAAKVEDAADSRRQGYSRSRLLQTLDNAEDAVSSAFPKGKQQVVFRVSLDFTVGDIQDALQKRRMILVSLSFHTFWRVVYATVGRIVTTRQYRSYSGLFNR